MAILVVICFDIDDQSTRAVIIGRESEFKVTSKVR